MLVHITIIFLLGLNTAHSDILRAVIVNSDSNAGFTEKSIDYTVLEDEGVGSSAGGTNSHTLFGHNVNRGCDDIAIIGAGIAGAYAAWRLRNTNQSITVYEYSNRIGGRLYTNHISGVPGFNAELGGMRYHEPSHPILNKTIRELGLTVANFDLGYGASNTTLMYLRGVHMRYKDLGGAHTPYNLRPQEMIPYPQLKWEVFVNSTDYLKNKHRSPFHLTTHDGIPLYKQSIQSVYAKTISNELAKYIKDVNSFLSDFGTTSAAYALPSSDPIVPGESMTNLKTITQGMSEVPRRLIKEFVKADQQKHRLNLNHHLKGISKQADGTYRLHFDDNLNPTVQDFCAKKVILAITRLGLEKLDWSVLKQEHIWELITKSVRDAHAVKFFLAYDRAWWRESNVYDGFAISDTPIHRTYDFGTVPGTNISVLNAVYSDNDVTLWEELVKRGPRVNGSAVHTVTAETVYVIHKYLAEIYNLSVQEIPQPVGGIIGVWDAYPIGGAWQEWKPGYIFPDVEKQMVKPSNNDEVYIASNAFNARSLSFWSESALEAAELVLQHFNV